MRWFLRMARWARNPPSAKQVRFVLAIVAFCVLLYAIERLYGWPDWATPNRIRGGGLRF